MIHNSKNYFKNEKFKKDPNLYTYFINFNNSINCVIYFVNYIIINNYF